MTDLRKAAERALEALAEFATDQNKEGWVAIEAIQELRQALAQPVDAVNMSQERVDETAKGEHKPYGYVWTSLRDGMEVRFSRMPPNKFYNPQDIKPVYTAPPKREWVGLTDDDIHDAFNYVEMVKLLDFDRDRPEWCEAFARACEARLRHRNGEKQ